MAAFTSRTSLVALFLRLLALLQSDGVLQAQTEDDKGPYEEFSGAIVNTQLVRQKPEFLTASVGESITLYCTVAFTLTTTKWYKDSQRLVYGATGTGSWAKRINPGSGSDISILITNIQPQDAGTYYCTEEFLGERNTGCGTVVSVIVPPKVWLKMYPPSPVQLNDTVTITCNVERFYPNDVTLRWLKNCSEPRAEAPVLMNQNQDGTFSLKSPLEVTATEERNSNVFTCQVVHNSQPSIERSATLHVISSSTEQGQQHLVVHCAISIALLLNKILLAFLLLYLFMRKQHSKFKPSLTARNNGQ